MKPRSVEASATAAMRRQKRPSTDLEPDHDTATVETPQPTVLAPETQHNICMDTDDDADDGNATAADDSEDSDVVPDTAEKQDQGKRRRLSASRRTTMIGNIRKSLSSTLSEERCDPGPGESC